MQQAGDEVVEGTTVSWDEAKGWGVVSSPAVEGEIWAHYSDLDMHGYRKLTPGQRVSFAYAAPGKDGYPYRAVWVRPVSAVTADAGQQGHSESRMQGLSVALLVVGFLLIAFGLLYVLTKAASLPGFLPGHVSVVVRKNGRIPRTHAHTKLGLALLLAGMASVAGAGYLMFRSDPKS